jgi:hypothetical protein
LLRNALDLIAPCYPAGLLPHYLASYLSHAVRCDALCDTLLHVIMDHM